MKPDDPVESLTVLAIREEVESMHQAIMAGRPPEVVVRDVAEKLQGYDPMLIDIALASMGAKS